MSMRVGVRSQILAHRRSDVWLPATATSTAWLLPRIREEARMPLLCLGSSAAGDRSKMKGARSVCVADALPHGRMPKADGPGVRNGAAMLAKSHSNFRVSRGSITSSTQKASAVR
jgi:hypothetical protein